MCQNLQKSYELLKQLILKSANQLPDGKLEELKAKYQEEINDPRALDAIRSLGDLLKLLEKRQCLSIDDVSVLQVVFEALTEKPENLERDIRNYNEELKLIEKSHPLTITYVYKSIELSRKKFCQTSHQHCASCIEDENSLKERVSQEISARIGRKWSTFARGLDFKEHQIDEINYKFGEKSFDKKCKQVLIEFFKREKLNWQINVMNALMEAERLDIKGTIQEILQNRTTSS